MISLAATRSTIDRSFNNRAAHLVAVAGSDKLRRWNQSLLDPLAISFGCSPKHARSASEVQAFFNADAFNKLSKTDEEITQTIHDFIDKVKDPTFDIKTIKSIMPLAEFFCAGSIRPAQKLAEKWKEMKILFKTDILVDRLIKHNLLVRLHPSVLAASLNYIFLRAHETISANTDFPPNLQGHKVNTLISLFDTIRTNHDMNGTKFKNLAWGSVSFDEARTARKRKQPEKPGKTTNRPKRQQSTKKPKSIKPKKRTTPGSSRKPAMKALRGTIPRKVTLTLY